MILLIVKGFKLGGGNISEFITFDETCLWQLQPYANFTCTSNSYLKFDYVLLKKKAKRSDCKIARHCQGRKRQGLTKLNQRGGRVSFGADDHLKQKRRSVRDTRFKENDDICSLYVRNLITLQWSVFWEFQAEQGNCQRQNFKPGLIHSKKMADWMMHFRGHMI